MKQKEQPEQPTLSRRRLLQTTAATGVAAAGGLGYSAKPATAHPAIFVGAGVVAGSAGTVGVARLLGGSDGDRDLSDYDAADSLRLHASAARQVLRRDIDEESHSQTYAVGIDSAENHRINQAVLDTYENIDEYADATEAADAAADRALDELADLQQYLLQSLHLHYDDFVRLLEDIDLVEDTHESDVLIGGGPNYVWNSGSVTPTTIDYLDVEDEHTLEYELVNGSSYSATGYEVKFRVGGNNNEGLLSAVLYSDLGSEEYSESFSVGGTDAYLGNPYVTEPDTGYNARIPNAFSDDDDPDYFDRDELGYIKVAGFPYDEYDDLDDESKDEIDPPDEQLDEMVKIALQPVHWIMTIQKLREHATAVSAQAGQIVEDNYQQMVDDDVDLEEWVTPSMLSQMTSDNNDFAYSNAASLLSGVGSLNSSVQIEWVDSDDSDELKTQWGQLRGYPSPSSGFSVGSTYNPENLDSQIFFDYQGETGMNTVSVQQKFKVVEARSINADGDWVAVDSVDFTQEEMSEPQNWDEIKDALDQYHDAERDAQVVQREIVVDLDGSGFFDDLFGGDVPPWAVVAAAVAGYLAIR